LVEWRVIGFRRTFNTTALNFAIFLSSLLLTRGAKVIVDALGNPDC